MMHITSQNGNATGYPPRVRGAYWRRIETCIPMKMNNGVQLKQQV